MGHLRPGVPPSIGFQAVRHPSLWPKVLMPQHCLLSMHRLCLPADKFNALSDRRTS